MSHKEVTLKNKMTGIVDRGSVYRPLKSTRRRDGFLNLTGESDLVTCDRGF